MFALNEIPVLWSQKLLLLAPATASTREHNFFKSKIKNKIYLLKNKRIFEKITDLSTRLFNF